jgi:hypothetical protein
LIAAQTRGLTEENPVLLLLRKVVFVVGNESESDDVRE